MQEVVLTGIGPQLQAVHAVHAKHAEVIVPSLDDWEKECSKIRNATRSQNCCRWIFHCRWLPSRKAISGSALFLIRMPSRKAGKEKRFYANFTNEREFWNGIEAGFD